MSADIFEASNKLRIRDYGDPPVLMMWRLASGNPRFVPSREEFEALPKPVRPDPNAAIDGKALVFLEKMHGFAMQSPVTNGNNVLSQADRLGVCGRRLGQFADLVGHDPKTGVALLQAASLAVTIPQREAEKYPGMMTTVNSSALDDLFAAEKKQGQAPRVLAVDGVIKAMARRYPGYSCLAY